MIGITLSSEQIRNAPADVRHWIEREVMASMNQGPIAENNDKSSHSEHLAACTEEEVAAILTQIRSVLPAVNVLFELSRQGSAYGRPDIAVFRLLDIAGHARLQNVEQVIACLDIIGQAFGRVCGDVDAKFYALDRDGHCFIATETQQSILQIWRKVIAGGQFAANSQDMAARPGFNGVSGGSTENPPADQQAAKSSKATSPS
ncbi:MAG TPA: hypothetical protein VHC94_07845 [Nitrobacter sp.]|nr:hypothetical protein [Nitrobacter sp.]